MNKINNICDVDVLSQSNHFYVRKVKRLNFSVLLMPETLTCVVHAVRFTNRCQVVILSKMTQKLHLDYKNKNFQADAILVLIILSSYKNATLCDHV